MVHESIEILPDTEKVYIKDAIKHYTSENISSLIAKMESYSTLAAQQKFKAGKKTSVVAAIFKSLHTFNRDYFFRKGIFYGYRGLVISAINAATTFLKYMKLYEMGIKK